MAGEFPQMQSHIAMSWLKKAKNTAQQWHGYVVAKTSAQSTELPWSTAALEWITDFGFLELIGHDTIVFNFNIHTNHQPMNHQLLIVKCWIYLPFKC